MDFAGPVRYNRSVGNFKLWRLLEKRSYQRKDIVRLAGISDSTYRKLLASEAVRMDVLQRICITLNVDVGDICSLRL
jgi:DNA-binding Xre family transcriptional regulator